MPHRSHYYLIAEAIEYIRGHFREQPDLDEVASHVHVSPFHFQRVFSEWAGVSPKQFLQYISIDHARKLLQEDRYTLSDAAFETGLSGTGRLHDLFIKIEAMTPAEYKNGGDSLLIRYNYAESLFGKVMVASTSKGICHLAFDANERHALEEIKANYPNAKLSHETDILQQRALALLNHEHNEPEQIKLHIRGSEFRLKVWEALLKIPMGKVTTYSALAEKIGSPRASRAVGSAIGSNPVAWLIPCHRVIRSDGHFEGYRWGNKRKTLMIGWESANVH
jgi:AraC family transcriptional regulator of adaptative response/methylated-DNA-[protein]-cysteine methyltransferase